MKESRLTKKFSHVLTASKGYAHAVKRNVRPDGPKVGKRVETYCGRVRELKSGLRAGLPGNDAVVSAGTVTCQSCIKAMAAVAQVN